MVLRKYPKTGFLAQSKNGSKLFASFFSSPKAKDLVEVLSEAKQVVNPKLTEMVMCGGFNRNANKRYGGSSFGGRGRGGSGGGRGRGGGYRRW